MHNKIKILNTNIFFQAKYLPLLGQILRTIGNNTVSVKLLEKKLQKWSLEKKLTSKFYRNHNGILTYKTTDKPTTAFKYYIEFLKELKLIIKTNDFVRCSKFGYVFNILDNELSEKKDFPEFEKVFYLYYLFNNDADALLLILDYINEQNKAVHKNIIAKNYKELLKQRLEHELLKTGNPKIRDKYLSLIKSKKDTKTISKRIIPPRVEWLNDLGIIKQTKSDAYFFTEKGQSFYKTIPKEDLTISKISRIDYKRKEQLFFSDISILFSNKMKPGEIPKEKLNKLIEKYLILSYKKINTDTVARISTLPVFILISMMLFVKNNIVMNYEDLTNILSDGFEIENKIFSLRDAARINESYILIKLK